MITYVGFHADVEACIVTLDVEDAFNRVPLYFLLYQLLELNIHPILINWISVALYQRKVLFLICGSWAQQSLLGYHIAHHHCQSYSMYAQSAY